MKKIFALIVLIGLVAGASFADTNIGVNLKGTQSDYVATSFEMGYSGDIIGVYGQVGLNDVSALIGVTANLGKDSPFFAFFGAGAKVAQETVVYTYDSKTKTRVNFSTTTETLSLFGGYRKTTDTFNYRYDETIHSEVAFTNSVAVPFMEAGLGMDMGPVYSKIGWTNYDGDNVTFSMGASF